MTTAVLEHLGPLALAPILGRSAFQRHLHHLGRIGIRRVGVRGEADIAGDELRRQAAALGDRAPAIVTEDFGGPVEEDVLVVQADAVFDPRLYDALAAADGPAVLVDDRGAGDRPVRVGLARTRGPVPSGAGGTGRDGPGPAEIRLSELPAYLPALRRELPPWWRHLHGSEDLHAAADRLIDATQKGVLDFPARYLHPAPENALTRRLAGTPVTPNQITLVTGVLGFAAAGLFAAGRFGTGLVLAAFVNVLDGVDGKLARVKLLASRFGDRLDHTLDVSFEFAWYLGIGWGLRGAGGPDPLALAGLLIATMLACRGVSGLYRLAAGRQIHDHTAFDRAFRLVAGRRNIYVVVLLTGWAAGAVGPAFRVCVAWAIGTLAVYVVRTAMAAAGRMLRRAA
ncbi:MAG: CDP-alcohol phosphatidyltransferase family protein [Gemmatimonadota bacterium]|nr:CDP-alcohol phosphatidyltransferase family protein [Gemmatimonadota bacterium]